MMMNPKASSEAPAVEATFSAEGDGYSLSASVFKSSA